MQTVDRVGLIAYLKGTLLELKKGRGIVVPEQDCMNALAALERGETIGLTTSGRIVSHAKLNNDGNIQEMEMEIK